MNELRDLHRQVDIELGRKLSGEKTALDERLRRLISVNGAILPKRGKRFYPKLFPKDRNPKNRRETWTGRGNKARWLVAQLRSGKKLENFDIKRA